MLQRWVETIEDLLKRPGIITEELTELAADNSEGCGAEVTEVLLRQCGNVQISEEVLKVAVRNRRGWQTIPILLKHELEVLTTKGD